MDPLVIGEQDVNFAGQFHSLRLQGGGNHPLQQLRHIVGAVHLGLQDDLMLHLLPLLYRLSFLFFRSSSIS